MSVRQVAGPPEAGRRPSQAMVAVPRTDRLHPLVLPEWRSFIPTNVGSRRVAENPHQA